MDILHLPLNIHSPLTLDALVQLQGISSKSNNPTPFVNFEIRLLINACDWLGNLWNDIDTRDHLKKCLSHAFLVIACIGGCISVRNEHCLTPIQKNVSLLHIFLFTSSSISLSSLLFSSRSFSSSLKMGNVSGANSVIFSASACLGYMVSILTLSRNLHYF